jgi:membrane-bound serine protease (ClpP class)
MGDKVTNDTAALARSQAALRGRNQATANLIVTESKSFSAEEAVKIGAIDLVATDLNDLLKKINGRYVLVAGSEKKISLNTEGITSDQIIQHEMSLKQKFLHFIANPNISTLLITLGSIAIFSEVKTGFTAVIPGLVGAFFMILGLISLQTLPINTGGALLFGLGFLLLFAEIYVTSFGLLAVAGIVSLMVGGLFLIDPASSDMRVSLALLIPLVASTALITLTIGYLIAKDSLFGKKNSGDPLLQTVGEVKVVTHNASDSSLEGRGRTGLVFVNGELWQFKSKDDLTVGDFCKIIQINGLLLEVERKK